MAVTFKTIQTFFQNNWRLTNLYGASKIAALFPNQLQQDGGAFKAEVFLPIMNESQTQTYWDTVKGFDEKYVTEDLKKVQLTQNFTVYNRISKVDKLADNWAENKLKITDSQKAKILDKYVLSKIASGVKDLVPNPVKITKENFVDELKRLEVLVEDNYAHLEDMIIFIDHVVVAAMVNAKIQFTQTSIEGTSATIKSALGFNFIEASIGKLGFQFLPVLPQAFAWVLAVDLQLQAGEYTHVPFVGQKFIVDNEFYECAIVQNKFVFGYKTETETESEKSSISHEQLDQAKNLAKSLIITSLPANYKDDQNFTKALEELIKADTIDKIYEAKDKILELIQ
ncbi:hypothetical protein [Spiroplasma phoeniceum]|uniref:Uncharacterized protein n=1 Tax=Spiroplasma phoeniceum P40 TaxID=1276259 RepID=A0A345DQU5_9MOLU|nr:hypothetical protein [Spiroplasma phoeniceum]AXF96586.1 hypothetical protein SDAV_001629 [Spiroplasma phoeniceum P40]